MQLKRRGFLGTLMGALAALLGFVPKTPAVPTVSDDWLIDSAERLRRFGAGVSIDTYQANGQEVMTTITVPTERNRFRVSVTADYLGCTVENCRSGKGSDLADGPRTPETWQRILEDVLAYELASAYFVAETAA
jgi:hypothetical protein